MINKTLIACALSLIMTGCGGGGSDGAGGQSPAIVNPTPAPAPTTPEPVYGTIDLVADNDFNFRTDSDLRLILNEKPQGNGVVNVYYDYDYHDVVDDIYYPNYRSRVLTFYPNVTTSVDIQVNKNWQHLIVEFVPTDAYGVEQYRKLDLTIDATLAFQF
jgi:hypothetical protein